MGNTELQLVKSEQFYGVDCDFYKGNDDEMWLTRKQIGEALEYSDGKRDIKKIHSRHKERLDKFSINLRIRGDQNAPSQGGTQLTTLYNERGVMEICRWSRQPKANEFMDWVWDIVQAYRHGTLQPVQKQPVQKQRETAITPIEKFFDHQNQILEELRDNQREFQSNIMSLITALTSEEAKIEPRQLPPSREKYKMEWNQDLWNWRNHTYSLIDDIVSNTSYTTRAEILRTVYQKMTNAYGIVWSEENKDFRKRNGIDQNRVSTLEVVFDKPLLKSVFDSIIEGIREEALKEKLKEGKAEPKGILTWNESKKIVKECCQITGNRSIGGTSFYAKVFRRMEVDWSKYPELSSKTKSELIRETPVLMKEFSRCLLEIKEEVTKANDD